MAPSRSASQSKPLKSSVVPASSPSSHQPRTIAGYHILPVSIPSSPPLYHYLYLRPHNDKLTTSSTSSSSSKTILPSDRTLFVVNLPVDATERHLRSLFEKAGRVQEVRCRRRHTGDLDGQQGGEGVGTGELTSDDEDQGPGSSTAAIVKDGQGNAQVADVLDKKARYRKAKKSSGPQAPLLHLLPSLEPRGDSSFLQTGSSAHVIFLEPAGVQRALTMASVSAPPRKWVDPQVSLLRSLQKETRDDDADDSRSSHLSRPSTAREAKLASASQQQSLPLGLSYFLQSYATHHPDLTEVKRHADSVVKRYTFFRSHPQLDPERERQDGGGVGSRIGNGGIRIASYGPSGEPLDEDGFTIVLPGGKYGKSLGGAASGENPLDPSTTITTTSVPFARRSQMDTVALTARARKEQEASAGLEDFYRFQNRERRKEKLADMRRKFEEDRERVEEMKRKGGGGVSGRRFKPY